MKTIEKIFLTFSFIGLAFFLLEYPFSKEILIFSLSIVSLLYIALNRYLFNNELISEIFNNKTNSNKSFESIMSFGAGNSLAMLIIGILLKIMNWAYFYNMIVVGLLSASIVAVVAFYKYSKTNNLFYGLS